MDTIKFLIAVGLAVFSWWFAANTNADGFFAVAAVCLATGIIVWKLDKIQRLLEEKNQGSQSEKNE